MTMGKYNLNVRITEDERQIINEYCEQEERSQSDVVREFVRSLKRKIKKNRDVEK